MRLLLLLPFAGCLYTKVHVPASPADPLQGEGARVGADDFPINPPLGRVLGGHGPNGLTALARRGGLACQAVYLSANQDAFAWVTCDLPFVSAALQRTVVEKVRATGTNDCAHLGADNLALSATHTHAGPGSHFVERTYTDWNVFELDSFSPRDSGYDRDYFDLLATQIAGGVLAACTNAQPGASARWVDARIDTSITSNRSVLAHCDNPEAAVACAASMDPRGHTDQTLNVLELSASGSPKAVLAFFAVHPTAAPNGNDAYHGDLVAEARASFRDRWRPADGAVPVVAFINGAEGDVSPAWPLKQGSIQPNEPRAPGFALARAVADELAAATLAAVWAEGPDAPLTLRRAHADVEIAGGQDACPTTTVPCAVKLDKLGSLGTAAGAGAEDGPTVYRYSEFAFAEGQKSGGADPKRVLHTALPTRFGALRSLLQPKEWSFARMAPLGLVEISGKRILLFPGEATVVAGARLREAARADVMAGLTSGYLQYLTTPEEYARQQYEGASTLYGAHELDFFVGHLMTLASTLGTRPSVSLSEVEAHPRQIAIGRGLMHAGGAVRPRLHHLKQFTAQGTNPHGDTRPVHASTPDLGASAMPFELVIRQAGKAFWQSTQPWAVDITQNGVAVKNRHGAVVDAHDQDVETRLLPSFFNRIPVIVSWFPDQVPVIGATYCMTVTVPGCAVGFDACREFAGPGWSEVSASEPGKRQAPDACAAL
ncbi:MAG: neutral/alkaline non-lysosomal ceramidase N-terminal domain-containing protein [Pseudomonadota bacterium]|nr:neutral/alkaline non-lysosomal ceramidase N-terminal domain-containing protein [Pseudomonadota bacterium]